MKTTLKFTTRFASLILYIILLNINVNGQDFHDTLIYGDTINLADSNLLLSNSETIVFINNESYCVLSTKFFVIDNLKNRIKINDEDDWNKALLDEITKLKEDIIYVDSIDLISVLNLKSIMEYINSDLIDNRKCIIYNKKMGKLEKKIRIEYFKECYQTGKNYILLNENQILNIYIGNF